jgi:hypothetical protein
MDSCGSSLWTTVRLLSSRKTTEEARSQKEEIEIAKPSRRQDTQDQLPIFSVPLWVHRYPKGSTIYVTELSISPNKISIRPNLSIQQKRSTTSAFLSYYR